MRRVAPTYILRFFFDAGSGTCFWSGNDAARAKYGYFIDPFTLPIDTSTIQEVIDVINAYDNTFNWDDPGSSQLVDPSMENEINASVDAMLHHVRENLGDEYDVVDERR